MRATETTYYELYILIWDLAIVDEAVSKYKEFDESLLVFGEVDLAVTRNLAKKKKLRKGAIALTKYRLLVWSKDKIKKGSVFDLALASLDPCSRRLVTFDLIWALISNSNPF